MNNLDLYKTAESYGMTVISAHIPVAQAVSYPVGNGYIVLDRSLQGRKERECLVHEIGHCSTGAFYALNSPRGCRERLEYRANAKSFELFLPPKIIQNAIDDGITELYDLSEHFGLSEKFIRSAIEYWTNRRGVVFVIKQ
ncbi:MAG: ImmA/IrrE family metallo-endopeptidase [Oscillospiraceae bacterium]|jgi:Zn-dependent peptidase ImmA (M78 family)|nr:ImmA/IrrE family metallo-endopeptidase [Oscillospiraceae bacterium]